MSSLSNSRQSAHGHLVPWLYRSQAVPGRLNDDVEYAKLDEIATRLDEHRNRIDDVQPVMKELFQLCNWMRLNSAASDWKKLVSKLRTHPVANMVHQDPFTVRAFSKPRGYAGDAIMMDYIYSKEENWPLPDMSPLGRAVFEYTTTADASAGVRARREFIANLLDEQSIRQSGSAVLAVASGHLREASMSSAVRRRRFGRFLALDADSASLKEVQDCYGRYGIETQAADIRKMLLGQVQIGEFDLVYSTGLYDYLNEKSAQRLTFHLFSLLRPGGRLVLANFLPDIADVGYMEAYMDWFLIYRNRFEMMGLTNLIDQDQIDSIHVSIEENRNIVFLEVRRN